MTNKQFALLIRVLVQGFIYTAKYNYWAGRGATIRYDLADNISEEIKKANEEK